MSIRLGGALRELRIHLSQTGKQSEGVRDFIQKHYVAIKKENPTFPILIRECNGVQPRVWARYALGVETSKSVSDMSQEQVLAVVKSLAESKNKGVERTAPLTDLAANDVLAAVKSLVK